MSKVIAILVSDIHLSHRPPTCRSAEPDWYEAMKRPFDEIRAVQNEHHDCPIICAGDIFDKWNPPPELINWAIANLPCMYAIPGQHDLPHHNYDDLKKSAYWTLVEADRLYDLDNTIKVEGLDLMLHPFQWDEKIKSIDMQDDCIHLAVAHKYVWASVDTAYPGAPNESQLQYLSHRLSGYDAAVFGDNHVGFIGRTGTKPCQVINCGTLMRRKMNEAGYEPMIGLLKSDCQIEPYYLECTSDEVWSNESNLKSVEAVDLDRFTDELANMQIESFDFREQLERRVSELSNLFAKQYVRESLE